MYINNRSDSHVAHSPRWCYILRKKYHIFNIYSLSWILCKTFVVVSGCYIPVGNAFSLRWFIKWWLFESTEFVYNKKQPVGTNLNSRLPHPPVQPQPVQPTTLLCLLREEWPPPGISETQPLTNYKQSKHLMRNQVVNIDPAEVLLVKKLVWIQHQEH